MKRPREIKKRINNAFQMMRDLGLMAKQDHMCCNECALNDLTSKYSFQKKGIVFTHKQQVKTFNDTGKLYISYAGGPYFSLPTKIVGHLVVSCLTICGVPGVQWDGDISSRILVDENENA